MRLVLYSLIPVVLFSNQGNHVDKDFIRLDRGYEKKAKDLKKESFENYSIGSKNWCKSPLSAFKLYIEGTYLDHLFLKKTQSEPTGLLFKSNIRQSLKQSFNELGSTFHSELKENSKPKVSNPDPNTLSSNEIYPFNLTSLRKEITNAIENLNLAVSGNQATTLNDQVFDARIVPFKDLQIGQNYWQKNILDSFSALESLKNLERLFHYTGNEFSQNIDLLSNPLKQNLLNSYFEKNIHDCHIDTDNLSQLRTDIVQESFCNKRIYNDLFKKKQHTQIFQQAILYQEAIPFKNEAAKAYLDQKKYQSTQEETHLLSKIGNGTCNLTLEQASCSTDLYTLLSDLVSFHVKHVQPPNIEQNLFSNYNNYYAQFYPVAQALNFKRYKATNLSKENNALEANYQKHNLFLKNSDPSTYTIEIKCPEHVIQASYYFPFDSSACKKDTTIACHFFLDKNNFNLQHTFQLPSEESSLEYSTINQSTSYSYSNTYAPTLLHHPFSYDMNYHIGDCNYLFSSNLHLANPLKSNSQLNCVNLIYKLHDFSLLDKLFNIIFDEASISHGLPSSQYLPSQKLFQKAALPYNASDNAEIHYVLTKDAITNDKNLEPVKFSFAVHENLMPNIQDLELEVSKYCHLASECTLDTINAIKLAKNEADLLKDLRNNPLNQVQSLSTSFSSVVQVIPNMKEQNYIFRIKMDCDLKKSPLKHTIYFVLDHTREMKKSEFTAYKNVINRCLPKLKKNKTFFNIITIGQDVYKLHTKNLKPTKGSTQLAEQFLNKLNQNLKGDPYKVFDVIRKIKYDSAKKNEMNTVILLSSLKPFKEFSHFKLPLQKIAQIKAPHFQLFGIYYGQKKVASGINLLAKLNKGHLISSTSSQSLYKKGVNLLAKIKRPFITDIKLTLADPSKKNIEFAYCSDYNPIIHSQKSFYIYGKINTLEEVKFIVQGKQGNEWINIVQQIDFKEANIAKGGLEKRFALEKSLYWYARYFNEPHPRFLKIAKEEQRPFSLPLP